MKFCAEHDKDCRAALAARGIDHLICETKEELERRQLEQGNEEPIFCPFGSLLVSSMNRIVEKVGPAALMERQADDGMPLNDGVYCPLCIERYQFNLHLNGRKGRCPSPFCRVVVKADDVPWDVAQLEGTADIVFKFVSEQNMIRRAS